MASSLIRLAARNSLLLSKRYQINQSIENLIVQNRQVSMHLAYQIEDFLDKKRQKSHSKEEFYGKLKLGIEESIKKGQQPENKNYYEIFKNQYLEFIYHIDDENETDILIEFLKLNKENILSKKQYFYAIHLTKLLYVLKKTDKSLELYKNEDIGEIFQNKETTKFLLAELDENERYQDIVDIFTFYFNKIQKLQGNDEWSHFEYSAKDWIVNAHVDLFSRALVNLNSSESLKEFKLLNDYLKIHGFRLSPSTVINIIMLAVKQGDSEYAREILTNFEVSLAELNIRSDLIIINLRALIHASFNEIPKAINEIKNLCDEKNPFIKDLQSRIFPSTLSTLANSISKDENHKNYLKEYENLCTMIKSRERLVRQGDFNDYSDFLVKKQYRKMIKKRQLQDKVRNNYDKNQNNTRLQGSQSSNDFQHLQPIIDNSNRNLTKNNKIFNIVDDKNYKDELVTDDDMKNNPKIIKDLFKENKFEEISYIFHKMHKSETDQFLEKLTDIELNILTNSLLLINSRESLETMKTFANICMEKKLVLDNTSVLHLYLLACFQNEPYYGLGYLVLSGINELSETLFKNLKLIAYIKLKNFDQAIKEIENIQNIPLQMFSNSGCVFLFVMDYFEKTAEQIKNTEMTKNSKYIKNKLSKTNRITAVNLVDYCSTHDNHNLMNIFFKEILENTTNENSNNHNIISSNLENKGSIEISNISEEINRNYNANDFNGVLKHFENFLIHTKRQNSMSISTENILADSILNCSIHITEIQSILDLVATKYNNSLSYDSQIKIFLKLIENDTVYALNFLADSTENSKFSNKYPSLFKNVLTIGLFLNGKFDAALHQIESVINTEINTENYEGMVFGLTVKIMENISQIEPLDQGIQDRIHSLINRINFEQRIEKTALTDLQLVNG